MKTYNEIISENSEFFQSGIEIWNRHNNEPEKQLELLHVAKSSIKEEVAKMAGCFFLGREYNDMIVLEEYVGVLYASGENQNCL